MIGLLHFVFHLSYLFQIEVVFLLVWVYSWKTVIHKELKSLAQRGSVFLSWQYAHIYIVITFPWTTGSRIDISGDATVRLSYSMNYEIFVFRGRTMDTDGAVSVLCRVITILWGLSTWRTFSATFTSSSHKVTMFFSFFEGFVCQKEEITAVCCLRQCSNMS